MASHMLMRLERHFLCLQKTHTCVTLTRHFQISFVNCGKKKMDRKISNMMSKLISRTETKKKWNMAPNIQSQDGTVVGMKRKRNFSPGMLQRAEHVSAMLYEHISQTVHSGGLHPELGYANIEISKVKVAPDFSGINVYWVATGKQTDDHFQKLLHENAGKLRHLLQSIQLLNQVPQITFVKDKSQMYIEEVEALLAIADFGDDFTPMEKYRDLHVDDNEKYEIPTKTNIFKNKVSFTDHSEEFHGLKSGTQKRETGFEFRQDVYGLQHDQIMRKLTNVAKKTPDVSTEGPSLESLMHLTQKSRKESVGMYSKLLKKKKKTSKQYDYSYADYLAELEEEQIAKDNIIENETYKDEIEDGKGNFNEEDEIDSIRN